MIQTHVWTGNGVDSDQKNHSSQPSLAAPKATNRLLPSFGAAGSAQTAEEATTSPGGSRPAPPLPGPSGASRGRGASLAAVGEGAPQATALSPLSSHLFERRLFRRARAGGTGRSQKRKMVPRILTSHLYIPGPSSSGGRHTPRHTPQSCRRRCRLRRLRRLLRLSHHSQGAVADL